jgi:hypothetical protein
MERNICASALVAVVAGMAISCGGKGDELDKSAACLDNRQYFEEKVWQPVLGSVCVKCHAPEGQASERNAKFLILPASYPGFLEANYEALSEAAKIEYEGRSQILQKPLGKMNHGGGVLFAEGSAEWNALAEFIKRVKAPVTCGSNAKPSPLAAVEMLDAEMTIRKAAIHLIGRLPTAAEIARARAEGDASLDPMLDAMMSDAAFLERVKEIYGDVFQVGRYNNNAVGLLNGEDWPNRTWFNPDGLPYDMQTEEMRANERNTNLAIAAEPLELVANVVRYNEPFGNIVAAPYVMVNPYSAKVYGVDGKVTFGGTDAYDFKPVQLTVPKTGQPFPSAGVMTSVTYLRRFPTTNTNLNRHRARMVYQQFLATDLLRVAERPIDPSSVTSNTPTRDDKYCSVCHKVIDPIAGAFQKWDGDGRFRPDATWPGFMPQPGIGAETINDVREYPTALQWLGKRLAADRRFVNATVYTVYEALTGHKPLDYPASDAPNFQNKLASWRAQDEVFRAAATAFVDSKQNIKSVFKVLIKSPYFRAVNVPKPAADGELEDVGTARWLTPEILSRKIRATMGVGWVRSLKEKDSHWLTSDYKLMFGGIDFESITKRLTEVNGIMAKITARMANEMSCRVTAAEFTKPKAERLLLNGVELDTVPDDAFGVPLPSAEALIKKNLVDLHYRVLGEKLGIDDPEIERTFQLFAKTYRELRELKKPDLPYDCQGRWDLATGADLPKERVVETDKDFTVRSWMAVMTYLLSDYKFLHE